MIRRLGACWTCCGLHGDPSRRRKEGKQGKQKLLCGTFELRYEELGNSNPTSIDAFSVFYSIFLFGFVVFGPFRVSIYCEVEYAPSGSHGQGISCQVLRQLCQTEEGKNCCECNSRKTMKTERWLTRRPKTFILSLVWPSSSPSRDLLWLILSMIQPTLRMEEIFQIASSNSCTSSTTEASPASASAERSAERSTSLYSFHGMICYCGMHYVAVFWCPARRRWIFSMIPVLKRRQIGAPWPIS